MVLELVSRLSSPTLARRSRSFSGLLTRRHSLAPRPLAPLRTTVVAVTGGPCAGKTTALNSLRQTLPALGLTVSVVPEFSTLFFEGGAGFPVDVTASRAHQLAWERMKLRAQMATEDAFRAIAEASATPSLVLVDRGAFDVKAFTRLFGQGAGDDEWRAMLEEEGWTERALLRRYDAVIHMVSAAVDAPRRYDQFGNAARRETRSEAKEQDAAIRRAWQDADREHGRGPGSSSSNSSSGVGAPGGTPSTARLLAGGSGGRFCVVESSHSFGAKIEQVRATVAQLCGVSESRSAEGEAEHAKQWVAEFDRIEAVARRRARANTAAVRTRTAAAYVRPGF